MNAPTPKSEIVIAMYKWERGTFLEIYTYSEAAQEWVVKQAPTFGQLTFETGRSVLWVSPGYDVDEVKAWLENIQVSE